MLLGTRVIGVYPRGEREEGGKGALTKAPRRIILYLSCQQDCLCQLCAVGRMLAQGWGRGWLMTVSGINPQKMLPAGGLVAVPFFFFPLHNEQLILAWRFGKGEITGRKETDESCLPGKWSWARRVPPLSPSQSRGLIVGGLRGYSMTIHRVTFPGKP